jgi:hypothetical protein
MAHDGRHDGAPGDRLARIVRDVLLGTESLHPARVGPVLVDAVTALGSWDVEVFLIDVEQRTLRALHAQSPNAELPVASTAAGVAYREQRVVDAGPVPGGRRLWVPILDSAERVGVLGVSVAHDDSDLIADLRALASLAGELIASKSAYGDGIVLRRRSQEMSLAAELRWALLPPLTFSSPEVDISGILEPAYEIAGDAFDYAVNGTVVHLAVLDAVGHGLEASRITSLAVAAYRHGRRRGLDLADTLLEMDRVVDSEIGANRFLTGQFAMLNTDDGLFRLVNAGHPAPVLVRHGADAGDVASVPCRPVGLGAVPTATVEVHLEPGDVVVLYSDGVTEARAVSGEFYGRDRLGAAVAASVRAGDRPAETLRAVVEDVRSFSPPPLRDDATLLLLTWTPRRRQGQWPPARRMSGDR